MKIKSSLILNCVKSFYLVMLFLFSCVYAISHFSQSYLLWITFVALFCHLCWEESLRTVSSIQEVYRRTIQSHNLIFYFTAYPPFHWFQFYFWFAFDHWICKWSVRKPHSWVFIPDSVHTVVCKLKSWFFPSFALFCICSYKISSAFLLTAPYCEIYCRFSKLQFRSSWRVV